MAKLRDSQADFFAAVGATAQQFDIREEFVEKDYWVTELLRSVAQPVKDAYVVFKGGTSLSKAYGIIERFSEDVDLLIVITRDLSKNFGKGSIDRVLKLICARAGEDLSIGPAGQALENSETGVHGSVRYAYPSLYRYEVVSESVLLELGRRGGNFPRQVVAVRSMIAEHLVDSGRAAVHEFDELAPLKINALGPERTLIEKLALLHRLGVGFPGTEEQTRRSGRHLYDIARLLRDERTVATLRDQPRRAAELAADADEQSRRWGLPFEPRPAKGYAASPIFEDPCISVLHAGYAGAQALIYGRLPTFEECIASVNDAAAIL